jgi:hypothetical protein
MNSSDVPTSPYFLARLEEVERELRRAEALAPRYFLYDDYDDEPS